MRTYRIVLTVLMVGSFTLLVQAQTLRQVADRDGLLVGTAVRTTQLSEHQAEIYRGIVRACLDNAGCTAIQTWGFTDKYSWIGSHSRGARGEALPFDRACQPKAAYHARLEEMLGGVLAGIDLRSRSTAIAFL
jgi:hypothetical protein